MPRVKNAKDGIILLIVLSTVLTATLLASIVLKIISSQFRLAHHQVSRTQAYYAAQAGVNYAVDKLRRGDWPLPAVNSTDNYKICRSAGSGCTVVDSAFPHTIQDIKIAISDDGAAVCTPPAGSNVSTCISATAAYTYQ